jgi:hypothetical protein
MRLGLPPLCHDRRKSHIDALKRYEREAIDLVNPQDPAAPINSGAPSWLVGTEWGLSGRLSTQVIQRYGIGGFKFKPLHRDVAH